VSAGATLAGRSAVFLRIVAIFVLFGPLLFTLVAMLSLAAFVQLLDPGSLGEVATISAGTIVIAYLVGLLPAAATGIIVALRDAGPRGAGPLHAALTGGGAAALVLAAGVVRLGIRALIKYPAVPAWLILSAAAASLVCWWIAIGRRRLQAKGAS
jgi:hypothetical protein